MRKRIKKKTGFQLLLLSPVDDLKKITMKRRTFLTASSTVGIATAIPGGLFASSVYNDFNARLILNEFNDSTKVVFDKFMENAILNIQSLELDENLAKDIVMPISVISKKSQGNDHNLVYKNKSGSFVSLSIKNGIERIIISKTV